MDCSCCTLQIVCLCPKTAPEALAAPFCAVQATDEPASQRHHSSNAKQLDRPHIFEFQLQPAQWRRAGKLWEFDFADSPVRVPFISALVVFLYSVLRRSAAGM